MEEWEDICDDFLNRSQIPNTIEAIDGKHIKINIVRASASLFYNYKGTHSLILMALVDTNQRFIYIDIGVNGRVSDGEHLTFY